MASDEQLGTAGASHYHHGPPAPIRRSGADEDRRVNGKAVGFTPPASDDGGAIGRAGRATGGPRQPSQLQDCPADGTESLPTGERNMSFWQSRAAFHITNPVLRYTSQL